MRLELLNTHSDNQRGIFPVGWNIIKTDVGYGLQYGGKGRRVHYASFMEALVQGAKFKVGNTRLLFHHTTKMTIQTITPAQYEKTKRGIFISLTIDNDLVLGGRYKVETLMGTRRINYNDFATIEEALNHAEHLLGQFQKLTVYIVRDENFVSPPDKAMQLATAVQNFILTEKGNYERTKDGEFNEFAVPQLLKRLGVLIGL